MTTPDGHIKVTFDAIDTAASDTDTIATNLNQQLDDLKTYLGPLVSTWTGQASIDYQALQKEWDTSAADQTQVLRQIAGTLRSSHQSYHDAEYANTNIWTR